MLCVLFSEIIPISGLIGGSEILNKAVPDMEKDPLLNKFVLLYNQTSFETQLVLIQIYAFK